MACLPHSAPGDPRSLEPLGPQLTLPSPGSSWGEDSGGHSGSPGNKLFLLLLLILLSVSLQGLRD